MGGRPVTGTAIATIPLVRLDNEAVWEAVREELRELVLRGEFILGSHVEAFEEEAAEAFGCRWAVGTSSGTSALTMALRASPLAPGSRVAVPANTFFATFEAIVLAGHVPVVLDHDEDHLISLDALEAADVDGVVPVHLFGLPVDMPELMRLAAERSWWVLEDCSQAQGATVGGRPVGSFGHAGAFSAYPTKNLGAWGDAGFVTGTDPGLGGRIRGLRHHCQVAPNVHGGIGGADRLDNIQALVLREKLRRLPAEVEARRRVGEWYLEALAGLGFQLPGDRGDRTHAFHQFVVRVPDRDAVREHLADRGIGSGVHYPTPVHLQPGARGMCEVPVRPVRSEQWSAEIVSLPMSPALTRAEVIEVAAALRAALAR
jgi:dTDP-4-amino-4,6-dideoxygalactose transaminase